MILCLISFTEWNVWGWGLYVPTNKSKFLEKVYPLSVAHSVGFWTVFHWRAILHFLYTYFWLFKNLVTINKMANNICVQIFAWYVFYLCFLDEQQRIELLSCIESSYLTSW